MALRRKALMAGLGSETSEPQQSGDGRNMPPLDYITRVTLAAWCNCSSKEDEPVCECGHRMSSHCLDDECCHFSYELGEIAGCCLTMCGCVAFRPSKQWLIQHDIFTLGQLNRAAALYTEC
jgi:hypothetical protein